MMLGAFNISLRLLQLAFATTVVGITAVYLNKAGDAGRSASHMSRFIYAEVVAAISMITALALVTPFSKAFTFWPFDVFLSLNWLVVFGLLANVRNNRSPLTLPTSLAPPNLNDWII